MPLLSAVNLKHAYGTDVILSGATLSVEPGERVGLVGRNGAGKSTLVKIIAGLITPDSGDVQLTRGRRLGYLRQDPDLDAADTVKSAAEGAFADLHAAHRELEAIYERMADASEDELPKLYRQQERAEERVNALGGYAVEHKVEAALHGLGFTDAQFDLRCDKLSGGQRARLALARLLLESPDIILLDEPTNHLDIAGREWLEWFLVSEFKGAVLMITHDRRMLDNTVSRIFELEAGRLIDYPASYSKFRELRAERRLTQLNAWKKQQDDFRRQEEFIRRFKTGQRAKEARGRESILNRQKQSAIEKPLELENFRFELPTAERPSEVVASARGVSKSYAHARGESGEDLGEKVLFRGLTAQVQRGERWGIVGPNGAGKSTLVKCLLGELDVDEGSVKLGQSVKIGYFRQLPPEPDPDEPLIRRLQNLIKKESPDAELSEQRARDLAGAFLFSGDDQDKRMGDLSGGERARVHLAAILASAKNVLVLDEPTNHLDIPGAERLEEALRRPDDSNAAGFDGTLILISHDRALLDHACDHLIVLDGAGGAEVFPGDYSMWRDRQSRREAEADAVAAEEKAKQEAEAKKQRAASEAKRKRKQRAEPASNALARMNQKKLESEIERIESRIKAIDRSMNDPDVWSNPKKCEELGAERATLASELEPLEFEWMRRADEQGASV